MADIRSDILTTAVLEGNIQTGATFSGSFESFSDQDWIKVTLLANQTYRFFGAVETNGGSSDALLDLMDSNGVLVTGNDDMGNSLNSEFVYSTGATGGTFYLQISNIGGYLGTYSIAATAQVATSVHLSGGNDTTTTGALGERIIGGKGDDFITLSFALDLLGEQGNDTLIGNALGNFISGGLGNDQISGGVGNDKLFGDAGDDQIFGGSEADVIYGGSGLDRLYGDSGADVIHGGSSVDRIFGNDNSDDLFGDSGTDYIAGADGNDDLYGGTDADELYGQNNNDRLFGESGDDILTGGLGIDQMTGGTGKDLFRFDSVSESGATTATRDYILDFVHGTDRVYLALIDAKAMVAGNQVFSLLAKGTSSSAVAEGKIGWYQANNLGSSNDYTVLRINNDGDIAIDMMIKFKGLINFTSSDFVL